MANNRLLITPNRHHLQNRFPDLSFTITNAQQRTQTHFEILLATNATLFHPDNASRRNVNNFYASRQDSGLMAFANGEAVYVVPMPVLKALIKAEPRPTEIYYTAVSYADNQGTNPQFAHDPTAIALSAPSVQIAADFEAQTLSTVLGIATDKLRRVGNRGYSFSTQNVASSPEEVGEEDGYMLSPQDATIVSGAASYSFGSNGNRQTAAQLQDNYENHYQNGNGSSITPRAQNIDSGHLDEGDEDGFSYNKRINPSVSEQRWSNAQESSYPYGASEPAALVDEDYDYNDTYTDEDVYEPYESNGKNGNNSVNGVHTKNNVSTSYSTNTNESFHDSDFEYDDGFGTVSSSYNAISNHADMDAEEYAESSSYNDYAQSHHWQQPSQSFAATLAYEHDEYVDSFDDYGEPPTYQALDTYTLNTRQLTIDDRKDIIEQIAKFESGNDYGKINADGEFDGRFGHNHSAYQTYHIGLSYGIVQFTQDGGNLGRVLVMMRDRDRDTFNRIFGEHADELIRVTTAQGPPSRRTSTGRSARVQAVGGADLWVEPWLTRFREAGRHRPFQSAQNEAASTFYIEPILKFAAWLGLNSDRALTIVADRSVQLGPGGARSWIIETVGPIQTTAQRQQALQALHYADLRAFQQATHGLTVDGDWGPMTHAALVAALRQLGSTSPIAIPTRDQMIDTMVRQSANKPWGHRVKKLRDSTDFNNTEFELVNASQMPRPAATTP